MPNFLKLRKGFSKALHITVMSLMVLNMSFLGVFFNFNKTAEAVSVVSCSELWGDKFEKGFSGWDTSIGAKWHESNDSKDGSKSVEATGDTSQGTGEHGNGSADDYIYKVITTVGKNNVSLSFSYKVGRLVWRDKDEGRGGHDDEEGEGAWVFENGLETDDTVIVQWSTDGSTWHNVLTIDKNSNDGVWHQVASSSLAGAADSAGFQIRFLSHLTGDKNDSVYIDNVSVYGCAMPKCGDGSINQVSEVCDDNNLDNGDGCSANCQIECTDADGDGYGVGAGCKLKDCDDTKASVNPNAAEVCDGIDNDCDGQLDEILPIPTTCGIGSCASVGQSSCVLGAMVDSCVAGAPGVEACDGILDEDCDKAVDEGCACTNGAKQSCGVTDSGECAFGSQACAGGTWGACVGAIEPVAEICDGLDNDCNGTADETFTDLGTDCSNGIGACQVAGKKVCAASNAGTVCDAVAGAPGKEECGNNIDEDCDGYAIKCACTDADSDDVCDEVDNCKSIANADQKDADNDNFGDVCDNCPSVANFEQQDDDKDGLGNACEKAEYCVERNCSDENACTIDTCDEDKDTCVHTPKVCEAGECNPASGACEVAVCEEGSVAILNGGFEAPALYSAWSNFPDGTLGLGWSVTTADGSAPDGLELQNFAVGWNPAEGSQMAELDGNRSTRIYQNVKTFAGAEYKLDFKYSARPGVVENSISVKLDGVALDTLNVNGSGKSNTEWQNASYTFTAASALTKIEFVDGAVSDTYGMLLDNVSLSLTDCTPGEDECEPTTSVIDPIAVESIYSWNVTNSGGNPIFSYSEIVSPYDGGTAIKTSVVGNTTAECPSQLIGKTYTVSGNTANDDLKAYAAFTSTMDYYNFPYIVVTLYDASNNSLGYQVYYGAGVISGIYAGYAAADPAHYTALSAASGDMIFDLAKFGNINFAKAKVTLANYACVGQNSLTFDNLRIMHGCGEECVVSDKSCVDDVDNDCDGSIDETDECVIVPVCGDGKINQEIEDCDDGNKISNDGCDSACQKEGLIEVCKYNYTEEKLDSKLPGMPLAGWTMNVSSAEEEGYAASKVTQDDGCVDFYVPFGDYVISEAMQEGWKQIVPGEDGNYIIKSNVHADNDSISVYFQNERIKPTCGDGDINQEIEECDGSDLGEASSSKYRCNSSCELVKRGHQVIINNDDSDTTSEESSDSDKPKVTEDEPIVLGEEGAPELTIAKTVNKTVVNPGEKDVEYTITVKNTGNLTAFGVKLNDILPTGLSFADGGGNTKTWDLGDIEAGKEVVTKYKVVVAVDATAKSYVNRASVSADNFASVSAEVDVEVEDVKVLAATGFDNLEFFGLSAAAFLLFGFAGIIRKKRDA